MEYLCSHEIVKYLKGKFSDEMYIALNRVKYVIEYVCFVYNHIRKRKYLKIHIIFY